MDLGITGRKAVVCASSKGLGLACATALARDLKHGEKMPGWKWDGWFVAIVDAHGHKIDEVPIADA